MDIFLMYFLFVVGLGLIIKGGDIFVDASIWIAKVSKMPKFLIGATIVSFATTLPEILVSSIAAYQGKTDMAIANGIGSVMANTGLVFAVAVICMPTVIKRKEFTGKSLFFLSSLILLGIFSLSSTITIYANIGLVLLFVFYIVDSIRSAKAQIDNRKSEKVGIHKKQVATNIFKFIFGAVFIVLGSNLLVEKGSDIASSLGIDERIISLTAVAIGTCLPELVTTISAIAKKQASLSVGNILGANVIDLTLIIPISSFLSGGNLAVKSNVSIDILVNLIIALILIIPSIATSKFKRWQGILSLIIYTIYMVFVVVL